MMNPSNKHFSSRHGHRRPKEGPLIRDDAPEAIRCAVLEIAHGQLDLQPSTLRDIVCGMLRRRPDRSNWSERPNIWDEVQELVHGCDWFRVYDIVEAIHAHLVIQYQHHLDTRFTDLVNQALVEEGIGWQLFDGKIEIRGDDEFEETILEAHETLEESGLSVASKELREARGDLSRRPEPDLTGAIQHVSASLESVLRKCSGRERGTLGDIVKRNRKMFPAPLDQAIEKLWGFASEHARHGSENRTLEWEEAQLCVGVAAVVGSYLAQKHLDAET